MIPRRALAAPVALAALLLAAPAGAAPLRYAALGDSTGVGMGSGGTGGYPARLARRLEASGVPVELELFAVSGATAADLRREQLPRLAARRPALVTIGVGINDVVHGRALDDFARDLEAIAGAVARTGAAVVLQTLPDLASAPAGRGAPPSLTERLEAFNAAIAQVAARHGFVLSDVYGRSRGAFRARGAELFSRDGFHPSARGYDAWADAIWPDVERAIGPRVRARHGVAAGPRSPAR